MKKEKCKICGKEIGSKGFSKHLRAKHSITNKEYYDKYYKKEGEGICPVCGKPTKFNGIKRGYFKHCSPRCSTLDKVTQSKLKKTIKEKYGTNYYFQSSDFKNKSESTNLKKYGSKNIFASEYGKSKLRATNKEKYGNEVFTQSDIGKQKSMETCMDKYGERYAIASKEVQDKIKETNLKRYGVECNLQVKEVRDKIKSTNLEKYGVENIFKTGPKRNEFINTMKEKYGHGYPMQIEEFKDKIISTKKNDIKSFIKNNNCTPVYSVIREYGKGWRENLDINVIEYKGSKFISNNDIPTISETSNTSICDSGFEYAVYSYIKNIYNGKIINRCRSKIKDAETGNVLELDIFLPDVNIAIECDGIYYHSYNFGTKDNYHLMKTRLCEKIGIRLIHITDWEWNNKREICQSIIASVLGIYKEKIYARQCKIKEVDNKEAKEFLNANHMQGYINASIKLGLYYKNELVQVIALSKSRFNNNGYELLRMCMKLNTQVIGGFSKLMSHLPNYIDKVISYVDRSKFTGQGYSSSGWELIGETKPGYAYYKNGYKYSRQQCQKHKLDTFLGKDKYDDNLSETENMTNNNYLKVYDCGNLKMKWKKRV